MNEQKAKKQAISALQKVWKTSSAILTISTSDGLEFINTRNCTPAEVVEWLKETYHTTYEVVNRWIENIDVQHAMA